jgi:NADPH:quinone reductase-like Zn-dependent oxidoreductase
MRQAKHGGRMKAIVLHEYGDVDRLLWQDVAVPRAGFGEVVIRNHAVGLNHCDTDLRRGLFGLAQVFPHVMGVDCSGVIAEIGPGVEGYAVGDRVSPHFVLSCGTCRNCQRGRENICLNAGLLGITTWGGYAQYTKVRQNNLIRLPDGLSFDDAVAAAIPFATAWEALVEVGRLRVGETVLVNAAGSGVGSAGIQIAKLAGARVIATTGAESKVAAARALGADEVLIYGQQDVPAAVLRLTDGLGVDMAFDMVGGARLLDCIGALAQGGRIVSVGAHGGEHVDIDMIELFRKHISLHGCGRSTRAMVADVLALVAAGKLKPVMHARFPLSEAGEAHRVMESRAFFGRMVMDPWS